MKIIITAFLFFIFAAELTSQTDTISFLNHNTRNYDQKHIKLMLSFDFDEEKVNGVCEFSFSPLVNNFNELVLHAKTMKVNSVTASGSKLEFRQDEMHLFVEMDKEYSMDDSVSILIDYTALPTRGLYFFKPTDEIPEIPYQIWTQGQGENNRYWYPAYDLPDDKLTSEIIITVPSDFIAVSNGILQNVKEKNDTKTFHWKIEKPYSNYLTSVIVGDYVTASEEVRGVTLEYNIPSKWINKKEIFYGRTPQMIRFFSDYIAPYPYGRYAQTTVQDFEWGGMENVTSTTLNSRILYDKNAVPNYSPDALISHELAHQWFGDYLTCRTWDHIWLNEGFATYFTDLWYEDEINADEFRYQRYLANKEYFDIQLKEEPLDTITLLPHIPVEMKGSKAYERGAAVLNMLRFILGDDGFEKAVKYYVEKFKNKNVVTEDLRIAFEESSGKDLRKFFQQWVYGASFPEFKVDYSWNEADKIVTLNVKQTQELFPAVDIFEIPVLVEITAGKELIQEQIQITGEENTFTFPVKSKPDLVRFNKYQWILCKVNFDKTFDELVYQLHYDDDLTGRITAAQELVKFQEQSVPELGRAAERDIHYGVRMEIVESLKKIGGEESLEPLLLAADDNDARVREAALKALSVFNYKKVEAVLLDKLENDDNYYVKGAALYSIGAVKHPDAKNILTEKIKMDSHRNIIRRGIFDGFKELGDPSVLPLVKEYTKYKYSYGGMHLMDIQALDCALSFANTHYEEVVEVITSALDNPYFRTRIHAAKLLADLGAREKLGYLNNIYENEKRIVVRTPLKASIDKLKKNDVKNN